jgi:hypothetical protein
MAVTPKKSEVKKAVKHIVVKHKKAAEHHVPIVSSVPGKKTKSAGKK